MNYKALFSIVVLVAILAIAIPSFYAQAEESGCPVLIEQRAMLNNAGSYFVFVKITNLLSDRAYSPKLKFSGDLLSSWGISKPQADDQETIYSLPTSIPTGSSVEFSYHSKELLELSLVGESPACSSKADISLSGSSNKATKSNPTRSKRSTFNHICVGPECARIVGCFSKDEEIGDCQRREKSTQKLSNFIHRLVEGNGEFGRHRHPPRPQTLPTPQ